MDASKERRYVYAHLNDDLTVRLEISYGQSQSDCATCIIEGAKVTKVLIRGTDSHLEAFLGAVLPSENPMKYIWKYVTDLYIANCRGS